MSSKIGYESPRQASSLVNNAAGEIKESITVVSLIDNRQFKMMVTGRSADKLKISKIKKNLVKATNIPVQDQVLTYNGVILSNDALLKNIGGEGNIVLLLSATAPPQASPGTANVVPSINSEDILTEGEQQARGRSRTPKRQHPQQQQQQQPQQPSYAQQYVGQPQYFPVSQQQQQQQHDVQPTSPASPSSSDAFLHNSTLEALTTHVQPQSQPQIQYNSNAAALVLERTVQQQQQQQQQYANHQQVPIQQIQLSSSPQQQQFYHPQSPQRTTANVTPRQAQPQQRGYASLYGRDSITSSAGNASSSKKRAPTSGRSSSRSNRINDDDDVRSVASSAAGSTYLIDESEDLETDNDSINITLDERINKFIPTVKHNLISDIEDQNRARELMLRQREVELRQRELDMEERRRREHEELERERIEIEMKLSLLQQREQELLSMSNSIKKQQQHLMHHHHHHLYQQQQNSRPITPIQPEPQHSSAAQQQHSSSPSQQQRQQQQQQTRPTHHRYYYGAKGGEPNTSGQALLDEVLTSSASNTQQGLANALANLKEFGREIGLHDLELDENSTCVVGVENRFNILITYDATTERLYLYSTLLAFLPKDPNVRLKLYETLLEGALMGRDMSGGGVGISLKNELIVMSTSIDLLHADERSLCSVASGFVDALERWRGTIQNILTTTTTTASTSSSPSAQQQQPQLLSSSPVISSSSPPSPSSPPPMLQQPSSPRLTSMTAVPTRATSPLTLSPQLQPQQPQPQQEQHMGYPTQEFNGNKLSSKFGSPIGITDRRSPKTLPSVASSSSLSGSLRR